MEAGAGKGGGARTKRTKIRMQTMLARLGDKILISLNRVCGFIFLRMIAGAVLWWCWDAGVLSNEPETHFPSEGMGKGSSDSGWLN